MPVSFYSMDSGRQSSGSLLKQEASLCSFSLRLQRWNLRISVQSERGCAGISFLVMLDRKVFHELAHTKMPSIAVDASVC